MIKFKCPVCEHRMKYLADNWMGKRTTCTNCSCSFPIAAPPRLLKRWHFWLYLGSWDQWAAFKRISQLRTALIQGLSRLADGSQGHIEGQLKTTLGEVTWLVNYHNLDPSEVGDFKKSVTRAIFFWACRRQLYRWAAAFAKDHHL